MDPLFLEFQEKLQELLKESTDKPEQEFLKQLIRVLPRVRSISELFDIAYALAERSGLKNADLRAIFAK